MVGLSRLPVLLTDSSTIEGCALDLGVSWCTASLVSFETMKSVLCRGNAYANVVLPRNYVLERFDIYLYS